VALELGIPAYVVWDADTDKTNPSEVTQHKKENRVLQTLLGVAQPDDWPAHHVHASNHCIWSTNLTDCVRADLGAAWTTAQEEAAIRYGHPGGLKKNPVAIAYAHERAWNDGHRCGVLDSLTGSIVEWASSAI